MDVLLGMIGLAIIVVGGWAVWRLVRAPGALPPPRPQGRSGAGDEIGGWLVGHQVANGRHDFPGDPLPDGHLGKASDLAFWGGAFDDDEPD
jgi:hypothetical protein